MTATIDFGRDTSCLGELRPGRLSSGALLVAEAAYRRLTTPRGTLRGGEDEANYGIDLLDLIGSTSSESDAAALPDRIRGELSKDERIDASSIVVQVTRVVEGPRVTFIIDISASTDAGPFTLKLAVNDVTVELLKLGAS